MPIPIGNATRLCNAAGLWTGQTPQCQPIACGDPVTFPHASVALINGSTVWRSVAQYACIHGYKEEGEGNKIRGKTRSVCAPVGTLRSMARVQLFANDGIVCSEPR